MQGLRNIWKHFTARGPTASWPQWQAARCWRLARQPYAQESGLFSNRPLEVLRDLVLAHVLGQVADPQVPRLAHHPAVGRRLGSRQAGLPGAVPPLPSSHSHLGEEERGREQRRRHRRRVRGHHHSLLRFQSLQRRETDSLLHIEPFPIFYYISLRCVVRAKCARLLHLLSLLRFSLD